MKSILLICAGLIGVGSAVAGVAPAKPQPVTVPNFGPRFQQTRERAEILLGHRNGSYPPPDARANLFQSPADITPVDTSKSPDPEPVESDESLLNEAVAALKKGKGGIIEQNGIAYLMVGTQKYREGDLVSVPLRSGKIEVRVTRITFTPRAGNTAVLRLNETEAPLRF